MKTLLISILCLLALIALAAAQDTDPAAKLSTKLQANRMEALNAINKCRRGVNPTSCNMVEAVWNIEAADSSLAYAKRCYLNHSLPKQRQLSNGIDCGENLFFSSYPASWTEVIGAHCGESANFVFGKGADPPNAVTGHYTQTVWYSSYLVGCDVYYCPDQPVFKYIFVVRMCPPGNIQDSINTPYTVGKPCEKCPNNCNNGLCTNPCPYNFESKMCTDYKSMCSHDMVKSQCPRTCRCTNGEIV